MPWNDALERCPGTMPWKRCPGNDALETMPWLAVEALRRDAVQR